MRGSGRAARGGEWSRAAPMGEPQPNSGIARSAPVPHPKEEERKKKATVQGALIVSFWLFSVPHAGLSGTGEPCLDAVKQDARLPQEILGTRINFHHALGAPRRKERIIFNIYITP